jgi:dephospho-CoA kinase
VITVGLTGSIGMGKSTTAGLFADEGVPVYDADAQVHALYARGGAAVDTVEAAFPGVVKQGAVDREALSARVLGDPRALKTLEGVVHPLVAASRHAFFDQARAQNADMVVLDIPLLFETGGEAAVDAVVVVSAPEAVQRARVLARPNMAEAKLDAILARQTKDAEKRARAHFIVNTGRGLEAARDQVREIIATLRAGDWPLRKAALEGRREPPH